MAKVLDALARATKERETKSKTISPMTDSQPSQTNLYVPQETNKQPLQDEFEDDITLISRRLKDTPSPIRETPPLRPSSPATSFEQKNDLPTNESFPAQNTNLIDDENHSAFGYQSEQATIIEAKNAQPLNAEISQNQTSSMWARAFKRKPTTTINIQPSSPQTAPSEILSPPSQQEPTSIPSPTLRPTEKKRFGLNIFHKSKHKEREEDQEKKSKTLVVQSGSKEAKALKNESSGSWDISDLYGGITPEVFVVHDFSSQSAEQVRMIRTNIESALATHSTRSIVITSATPGDGKSLVAANLACALSENADRKVLLIDADMRKGEQYKIFNIPASPGLTECLSGQCSLKDAVYTTHRANFRVMPSGRPTDFSAALLSSDRMMEIYKVLTKVFDWVIFDTPPIVPVADPLIIARECSGLVFVVRLGKTRARHIERAQEALAETGAPVLGCVVNSSTVDSKSYGYGYGYSYGYGYGYGHDHQANPKQQLSTHSPSFLQRLAFWRKSPKN